LADIDATSHPPQATGLKDAIEFATKLVAGIAGVCYAVGLLATNLYLTEFGFTDFSVLRPKSVLTGGWVLGVLLTSSSPVFVAWYKNRNRPPENRVRRAWAYIRAYLIACLIPWIVLAWFIHVTNAPYDAKIDHLWRPAGSGWDQALFNALLFIILGLVLGVAVKSTVYASQSKLLGPGLIIRATVFLISSLLLVGWFDDCIFPGLPASLAGGKIEKVMLLADKSHRAAMEELRIPLNPSATCPDLTDVVGLIYETEHSLLIQRGDLPPTMLDRSLVSGIVHDSSLDCSRTNFTPGNKYWGK
jgi:hypothetical protein